MVARRRGTRWWAALTPEERSRLVRMERADNRVAPEGACTWCGVNRSQHGLCKECGEQLRALRAKADAAVAVPPEYRFQVGDRIRSKLFPKHVGEIELRRHITAIGVPGYVVRRADGEPRWICDWEAVPA